MMRRFKIRLSSGSISLEQEVYAENWEMAYKAALEMRHYDEYEINIREMRDLVETPGSST